MGIAVLGPVTVDGSGGNLAPRERTVLAAMTLRHGEVVPAETLAEVLWGENPPPSWVKVIQGCVVRLRRVLGKGAIETLAGGYCLVVPPDHIDACRFEGQLARARELLVLGDPNRAAYLADEALGLWRGRAFTDLDNWDRGRIEAGRLEELRLETEELRIEAGLQAGRYYEVLAQAHARVAEAPLRERRWALLALAQYQGGRQADALRSLQRARSILMNELGLDPGPDITALEEAILRQDPSLVAAHLPQPGPECPYPGLLSYGVGDAESFFGRDAEVAECLRRLSDTGVLAVVGPSGSGKSSLVRAGVVAAMAREGRRVVVITPGPHPTDGFPTDPDGRHALVIDQFEEAVTLCKDAEERSMFITALVEHAEKGQLVIALRADRLGEMSAYPEVARLLEEGLYLLKPMEVDGLRRAIEGPAQQAGFLLEPGLVDLILRDAEGEPGALPLLSHTMREVWERREANTLTVAGYQETGGIRGAVAQSAERVYEQTPPEQRSLLRSLFLRLVVPTPDGEPVRSRVPLRVVTTDAEHEQIIEQLVEARLITSDDEAVELAHEALARAWPRFRGWLDDDVEGQQVWRHLSFTADNWDAMGRPDSELYRGVRLARAVEWRDRADPDLSDLEKDFLQQSQDLADVEKRVIAEQARRQGLINRRLRLLVTGVGVLALIAGSAFVIALRQAERADAEAALARSHELAASAISVLEKDPSLAKLLAVAAATASNPPTLEVTSALHQVWASDLITSRYGAVFEVGMMWADLHPSGDRLVASGAMPVDQSGPVLEVVDLVSDEVLWSLDLADDPRHLSAFVGSPSFSEDGRHVLAGVFWDPYNFRRLPVPFDGVDEPDAELVGAHVWDADSGDLIDRFDLGRCGGLVVAHSNRHLLVKTLTGIPDVVEGCRWADGQMAVELIDVSTREHRLLTTGIDGSLWGAAMSGDGRRVAVDDGESGEIVVRDVDDREILRIDGWGVRDLNRDGSLLLAGDAPIEVWDVATGGVVTRFDGHGGRSLFARFGPSGGTVLSTGVDGTLREWDALTGAEVFTYPGVGNGRPSFTADGRILVVQLARDTAALLDTRPRGEVHAFETCTGLVPPDSLTVIDRTATFPIVCQEGQHAITHFVDLESEELRTLEGHQTPALAVSPDGATLVRQEGQDGAFGPLVVRETHTGAELVVLEGLCAWGAESLPETRGGCRPFPDQPFEMWAQRVVWSPDGTMIAATVETGFAVWDVASGSLIHAEAGDPARFEAVDLVFSPDSEQLVVTNPWLIRAVDTRTWENNVSRELFVDGGYHLGLTGFTPDGSTLLAVGAFDASSPGALHWFAGASLDVVRSKVNVHEGIRTAALNPAATRMVTGAADGLVRVWDVGTGDLIHEIPFGNRPINGVAFVDQDRLAVTPADGDLLIFTLDPGELLDIIRNSLTRGFTLPECDRFGFGDACPTLAELRGAGLYEAEEIDGTYHIDWKSEELAGLIVDDFVSFSGVETGPDAVGFADDLAGHLAGGYTVGFHSGRFDITSDRRDEPFCTGTYTVRDDRVWLSSERGWWCGEVKFFDARFEVDDEGLRISADDFRGQFPDKLVFTSRLWKRVG